MMDIVIRKATIGDIPFLVTTIIEAEKSGTDKFGLSTLFGLSESEVRESLAAILNEEIDGCEFSISSFLIAEKDSIPIAAVGGWVEGKNEEEQPSAILKANLLSFHIPMENLLAMKEKTSIISGVQIEREQGSYQIEYVYVEHAYRGLGLIQSLIDAHTKNAQGCKSMFVQVFANNANAIHSYTKAGFDKLSSFHSSNMHTKDYLPDDTKLLMIKRLK